VHGHAVFALSGKDLHLIERTKKVRLGRDNNVLVAKVSEPPKSLDGVGPAKNSVMVATRVDGKQPLWPPINGQAPAHVQEAHEGRNVPDMDREGLFTRDPALEAEDAIAVRAEDGHVAAVRTPKDLQRLEVIRHLGLWLGKEALRPRDCVTQNGRIVRLATISTRGDKVSVDWRDEPHSGLA
jgi:hypothetical protein